MSNTSVRVLCCVLLPCLGAPTAWSAPSTAKPPPVKAQESFAAVTTHVTNVYFSDKLLKVSGFIQPNAVINLLRARQKGIVGYFVLDLVMNKGEHQFDVEILDRQGVKVGEMGFEPVLANESDFVYTMVGAVTGELPEGWLLFRVFDLIKGGKRQGIGEFRVMSRVIPMEEDDAPSMLDRSANDLTPTGAEEELPQVKEEPVPFPVPKPDVAATKPVPPASLLDEKNMAARKEDGHPPAVGTPSPDSARTTSSTGSAVVTPSGAAVKAGEGAPKPEPVAQTAPKMTTPAGDGNPPGGLPSPSAAEPGNDPDSLLLGKTPPPTPAVSTSQDPGQDKKTTAAAEEEAFPPLPPVVSNLSSGYVVQLGLYSVKEYAEEMKQQVGRLGLPVGEREIPSANKSLTRIFLGPFATRSEAQAAANTARARARLKDAALVMPFP